MLAHSPSTSHPTTHEVTNQPGPLEDYNIAEGDPALLAGLEREGADWAVDRVRRFGALLGSKRVLELGTLANRNTPILRTHDRFGNRIDEVEFHPAYHEMMKIGIENETHSLPWTETRRGSHVARAALLYILGQVEAGVGCPISMTYAAVPALGHTPEIAAEWIPRLTRPNYDPRFIPAEQKTGCTMGMAMTEKQGGSDVRANSTRAVPLGIGGSGGEYELTGHKWFCSAPMCDAFLTLAQTDKGLTCFLVPRWLPDGTRNKFFIQRLKDKLGNRSNASSEIEYNGTWARMVGEEGRGIPTIIDMVQHTRLDCVIQSSALMRQGVIQALHHCSGRSAFGKRLIDQPLMRNVLADLAIEAEAATISMLRLARAYDDSREDEGARLFCRLATAVLKYWICKRAPQHVYECLECHGGNGYVEDGIMARLFREAPLMSIWEGSGNVIALDVLRAIGREPESLTAFFDELSITRGADPRLDALIADIKNEFTDRTNLESRARRIAEKMALAIQASLVLRHAHGAVASAFCASRLQSAHDLYGTLDADTDFKTILSA
jgi:putative acyl-CoA dehydrogenase